MTCKDCIHYEVCSQFSKADETNHEYYTYTNLSEKCGCFKDKSLLMLLPCKVGDMLYEPTDRGTISEYKVKAIRMELFSMFVEWDITKGFVWRFIDGICAEEIGKTVFLTREAAERALKENEKYD